MHRTWIPDEEFFLTSTESWEKNLILYIETCTYYFSIYRVFDNERNEALVYQFGQKDAYDVGHMAKFSYVYDILISGF